MMMVIVLVMGMVIVMVIINTTTTMTTALLTTLTIPKMSDEKTIFDQTGANKFFFEAALKMAPHYV